MGDKHDSTKEARTAAHDNTSARRRFLGKAGKAAVTTSAVTLMLSAGAKASVVSKISGDQNHEQSFNEWH